MIGNGLLSSLVQSDTLENFTKRSGHWGWILSYENSRAYIWPSLNFCCRILRTVLSPTVQRTGHLTFDRCHEIIQYDYICLYVGLSSLSLLSALRVWWEGSKMASNYLHVLLITVFCKPHPRPHLECGPNPITLLMKRIWQEWCDYTLRLGYKNLSVPSGRRKQCCC